MKITQTELPGVVLIEPRIFPDARGHFLETYHGGRYREEGVPNGFVQDNLSISVRNVLRGMHYQIGRPQGKLVMVPEGEIFDVVVDIRRGSPHFGKWVGVVLSARDYRQVYIPEGFAHGFCVMSERAAVLYKCTDYYSPKDERGLRWNDPALGVSWPVRAPILSEKDGLYPCLNEIPPDDLPLFEGKP